MTDAPSKLCKRQCKPSESGVAALSADAVERLLLELDGWSSSAGVIAKTYRFADHWRTMAFVNAIAWISHQQDHHPDLHVGYDTCRVQYSTHAVRGLTELDFICAAKVAALLRM